MTTNTTTITTAMRKVNAVRDAANRSRTHLGQVLDQITNRLPNTDMFITDIEVRKEVAEAIKKEVDAAIDEAQTAIEEAQNLEALISTDIHKLAEKLTDSKG